MRTVPVPAVRTTVLPCTGTGATVTSGGVGGGAGGAGVPGSEGGSGSRGSVSSTLAETALPAALAARTRTRWRAAAREPAQRQRDRERARAGAGVHAPRALPRPVALPDLRVDLGVEPVRGQGRGERGRLGVDVGHPRRHGDAQEVRASGPASSTSGRQARRRCPSPRASDGTPSRCTVTAPLGADPRHPAGHRAPERAVGPGGERGRRGAGAERREVASRKTVAPRENQSEPIGPAASAVGAPPTCCERQLAGGRDPPEPAGAAALDEPQRAVGAGGDRAGSGARGQARA